MGDPADVGRLRAHVEALEGERHWRTSPDRLEAAFAYAEAQLSAAGWQPRREPFEFGGRTHINVVAMRPGADQARPRVLIGAHVDTVVGTPGADDNASGVAGVLEAARLLGAPSPALPIELAVWNLEERQGTTYRVGSRRHVAAAKRAGVRYAGALVLEMIGYRAHAPESQRVPLPVRWMDLPRTGDFLAVIADMQSRGLLKRFLDSARGASPDLRLSHLTVPFRGWAVLATRRSDNASFWSNGFPALMLTDTADLRTPHYHRSTDTSATLDYAFMSQVVDAVVATARSMGSSGS